MSAPTIHDPVDALRSIGLVDEELKAIATLVDGVERIAAGHLRVDLIISSGPQSELRVNITRRGELRTSRRFEVSTRFAPEEPAR